MQLWQLLTMEQLRSRRLVYCQMWGENRKNCTSGIWIVDSRFWLGDVLLWDLCSWFSPSLAQLPLLASPVMLPEDFSPGSCCHFPAPGSCQPLSPGTSSDVDIPPPLANKDKVMLSSLSVKPGRLQLKICAAHIVPLTALWLTGKEEINEGLGQRLPPLFAKKRIARGLKGPVTECKYWIKAASALV